MHQLFRRGNQDWTLLLDWLVMAVEDWQMDTWMWQSEDIAWQDRWWVEDMACEDTWDQHEEVRDQRKEEDPRPNHPPGAAGSNIG
ncbi:hypothetical protein Y1Q_0009185 [Alligator mississippiensis]|uniref:Uncharacterized protein n=1 Tax=Alligator mississippiensis TaxID=8496 RepID=A0A151M2P9_ALLMI|nr:hypothetical protein Y1Q_0009185 [Alligator mississippiensis]